MLMSIPNIDTEYWCNNPIRVRIAEAGSSSRLRALQSSSARDLAITQRSNFVTSRFLRQPLVFLFFSLSLSRPAAIDAPLYFSRDAGASRMRANRASGGGRLSIRIRLSVVSEERASRWIRERSAYLGVRERRSNSCSPRERRRISELYVRAVACECVM